jgi:hypothetical protein
MAGYALLVGPDGSGKSTITDGIALQASQAGVQVRTAHYRPGVIAGRPAGANVTTRPHERTERGFLASIGKLVLLAADALLGYFFVWRKDRRRGLLLVERGWWDMAVDPHRYRLHPRMTGLVYAIGLVLPRADIVILLAGDGQAIDARKTEIGAREVARQVMSWRRLAPRAGRRVVMIDTVKVGRAEAIDQAWRAVGECGDKRAMAYRRVPLTPKRLDLSAAGRSRPAARLYRPFHPVRRILHPLCFELAGHGLGRAAAPPLDLDGLCRFLGFSYDGVVIMQSSRPGRWVVGLCVSGALSRVIKIGQLNDAPLCNEAQFLTALQDGDAGGVSVPRLLAASEWQDHFVVATSALPRSARRTTLEDALGLCTTMVMGSSGVPAVVHGDFAPWNVIALSHGPVVLDWENARFARAPMFDLAHFVITRAALVGRTTPDRALQQLCGNGSAGQRHLEQVGEYPDSAPGFVLGYLDSAPILGDRVMAFRDRVRKLVNTRVGR